MKASFTMNVTAAELEVYTEVLGTLEVCIDQIATALNVGFNLGLPTGKLTYVEQAKIALFGKTTRKVDSIKDSGLTFNSKLIISKTKGLILTVDTELDAVAYKAVMTYYSSVLTSVMPVYVAAIQGAAATTVAFSKALEDINMHSQLMEEELSSL